MGTQADPVLDAQDRSRRVVRTSMVGIAANVLLAAFKAVVGIVSHSIAITLDAVNNLSDAASSVITIVGTRLAAKQPDRKHPFGHGRIEYITTIVVAAIVLAAGVTSLFESVNKIFHPEVPNYTTPTLVVVGAGVAVKIVLGLYTRAAGERLHSGALKASGADALNDSIISAATLVAAFLYIFAGVSLEAWLAAVISVIIIKSGVDMLVEVLNKILGERIDADLARGIKETVCATPGVHGAYDLIIEDHGPDSLWGSIHVELDADTTAAEIDRLTRKIQVEVLRRHRVVLHTVGVYSVNESDDMTASMRAYVLELAEAEEYVQELHGFFVDEERRLCTFDLVVSFDAPDRRAVSNRVQEEVQRRYPDYTVYVALDRDMSD